MPINLLVLLVVAKRASTSGSIAAIMAAAPLRDEHGR